MDLTGRVVAITGASRGLGAGMAEWFAAHGVRLGLCARNEPPAPDGAEAVCAAVDVTDAGATETFVRLVAHELGSIDLWINNAGVLEPIVAQRDLDPADLAAHLAINVGGVLIGTQAYLRHLDEAGRAGALVNISSGASQSGRTGWSAYCAGKAAVDRLTETIAVEEPDRLPVALSVAPGLVDTDMQALIREQGTDVMPDVDFFRQRKTDGTMNSPAFIAETIAGWVFEGPSPDSVFCRVPDQPR
ncbi:MAG: SDR family NAD(P)-dependent oxidoreductase [Actinomycetia bacterium]|nr:SDR family NAD(P)-dependent oxidoreductase [Actinomycetes bacterium]MCP4087366.1 SDR family NAD(P)-dependent oxidoreductase [Actinomycetes bacterium]